MKRKNRSIVICFSVVFIAIVTVFIWSVIRNREYNEKTHQTVFAGDDLFRTVDDHEKDLAVRAEARSRETRERSLTRRSRIYSSG